MGSRFTRVTVVGDRRQIDVSLPADEPVGEQLPFLLRLLSVPVTGVPARWRLAAPEFGPLEPARSLDEVGVLDGTRLYLTEAVRAPPRPFVDDVENAVADMVAERAPSWTGSARRNAVGTLLAVLLAGTTVVGMGAPAPVSWISPTAVVLVALAAGALINERGGWACALVAIPAAAALVIAVAVERPYSAVSAAVGGPGEPWAGPAGLAALTDAAGWKAFGLTVAVGSGFALTLAGLVRRSSGVIVAGAAAAFLSFGALACDHLGMPADRTAGLILVASVTLAGMAGRLGVIGAGLVALMVADERGEPVARDAVAAAVRRGMGISDALIWISVLSAALCCSVLIIGEPVGGAGAGWSAPALGTLGALIFGLRSRMFSRAGQVGPMWGVPVVTAVAVAVRSPSWFAVRPMSGSVITLLVVLISGVMGAVFGLQSLPEVAAARLQRILERLEVVAVLALVPGLVLLFRVIPMVQRWWS